MEGWVKLHRKLTENPLWRCEPFTRGQAWIDLILLANHKRSYYYKRNIKIVVERGQIGRSEVELADRWKWSRNKVRKFLKDLQEEQQIEQQKGNVTQIVTILNYEYYQGKEQQEEQQTKQEKEQPKDKKKPAEKQHGDTYKNEKNKENEEEKEEPKKKIPTFEDKYIFFIKNFNEITKRKFRGDDKTKRQFKARLKNGYIWLDFKKAIENLYKDKYHIESGFKYATPELLTRPEKFELYLNITEAEAKEGIYPGRIGLKKEVNLLETIKKRTNEKR